MPLSKAIDRLTGNERASVVLAYCHGEDGNFKPAFVRSLVRVLVEDRGRKIHGYITAQGLYVPRGRNEIVGDFLNGSACDWLWFLDTDVEFPADTLDRLLQATADGERKIVAAPYWSIDDEGEPYCTWMGIDDGSLLPFREIPAGQTIELDACGMGCTLIHRDVFVDIAAAQTQDDPWIWFGHDLVATEHGAARLGEDVSFCIRAAQVGHATWGVCDIVVDHLKLQATQRGKVVVADELAQAT